MKHTKLILVFSFLFISISGTAQNDAAIKNIAEIDSFVNDLRKYYCFDQLDFPKVYKKDKIKGDQKLLEFINLLSNKGVPETLFISQLKKKGKKYSHYIFINGLIKSHSIVLVGNYIRLNATLEFIGDTLFRSRVALITEHKVRCGSDGLQVLDYNYLKNHIVNSLMGVYSPTFDDFYLDTLFVDNLKEISKNRLDYKFHIPGTADEQWINVFFAKQYKKEYACCYQVNMASDEFVKLIKAKKYEIIENLLFSPNYFTSVNAMESLQYLQSKSLVQLSTEGLARIDLIKNSGSTIIKQMAPEVFYHVKGYTELNVNTDYAIRKYRVEVEN